MARTVLAFDKIEYFRDDASFSKERIKKAEDYKFEDDKKRCLLSEVLLKKALFEFGIKVEEINYSYNEHGKPYLKEFENLFFNISHSGDYVLCAVSDCEIGLDIEKIEPINLRIAERFFTKAEFESITKEPETEQYDAFYSFWTRKEAYVKCIGRGMSCAFNSFDVNNLPDYKFVELHEFPGYKCSMCTKEQVEEFKIVNDSCLCPVCKKHVFTENYEICPICDWENDPVQRKDPDFAGGANKLSLNDAIKEYEDKANE